MKIFLAIVLMFSLPALSQSQKTPKPGVKEVQVPFSSLTPSAEFKIGENADWVLTTANAVWIAGVKPFSLQRINPATNKVIAKINLPGEACAGLASGFGSIWVPICGEKPSLVKVSVIKNKISATLPFGPAGPEGGIAASVDSVWLVTDDKGTLSRINPLSNKVRQKITIAPGSYNPISYNGTIWITGNSSNVLIAVDAASGRVKSSIPIGPKPRFLTAGSGSVWTLNQGDGTISRVDASTRKLTTTIAVGIPGSGGDIGYGSGSIWATVFDIPLSRIDVKTNKVTRQWVGKGGDSLRFAHSSIWLTDYRRGLLWRIPGKEIQLNPRPRAGEAPAF